MKTTNRAVLILAGWLAMVSEGRQADAAPPQPAPTQPESVKPAQEAKKPAQEAKKPDEEAKKPDEEAKKPDEEAKKSAPAPIVHTVPGGECNDTDPEPSIPKWDQCIGELTNAVSGLAAASTDPMKAMLTARREQKLALESAANPANAFDEQGCGEARTICVDHKGRPFHHEEIPAELSAGDQLTVKTFLTGVQKDEVVTVSFYQRRSLDVLIEKTQVAVPPRGAALEAFADKAIDTLHVAASPALTIEASEELAITITNQTNRSSANHRIRIRQGYSYFTVSLLVASISRGDRKIRRDLSLYQDNATEAAFALSLYPFGRPRGTIGFWKAGWNQDQDWSFTKAIGRSLSMTVATDVDLTTPLDRLFIGLSIEPVAGFAVSTGMSLRQVDFLSPGSSLPNSANSMDVIPTEKGRVLRPYIGITLSLELLDTLAELKKAASKIDF